MVFIDGSNWYHGLRKIQVDSGWLDYRRVAKKLMHGREPQAIHYYVGKISSGRARIAAQNRFLKRLEAQGVRVSLGRIEKNRMDPTRNPMAQELIEILTSSEAVIPEAVREKLNRICQESIPYYVEKQTDVRLAVDLISKAHRNEYDVAYLLSADGDFVPAVTEARRLGKTVCAASASPGRQLTSAVDEFTLLRESWFDDPHLVMPERRGRIRS